MRKSVLFICMALSFLFLAMPAFGFSNPLALDWGTQQKIYSIISQKALIDTIQQPETLIEKSEINVPETKRIIHLKNDNVKELTEKNHDIVYYIPFINEYAEDYCMIFKEDNTGTIEYTKKLAKKTLMTYQEIDALIDDTIENSQDSIVNYYSIPYTGGSLLVAVIEIDNSQYIMPIEKGILKGFSAGKVYTEEDFTKQWDVSYSHKTNHASIWLRALILTLIAQVVLWPVYRLVAKINK